MRTCFTGLLAALFIAITGQGVAAEQPHQATRQSIYEAQSRRYVADRTRRVTPRVNPSSKRLVYVDRSTRYDGNVYSGYGNRTQARVVHSQAYATPATVTYVTAEDHGDSYGRVLDGDQDRVVVVQPTDNNRRYAGYARYKNARSLNGYSRGRSYSHNRDYYPQRVYQRGYHRPAYVSYGYSYGRGYGHCDSYGYGVYRHGYGHHYGHRRHGGFGHFGYHRGHHRSHTGFSVHFRF